jgi:peptide/nickel transport system permease protein
MIPSTVPEQAEATRFRRFRLTRIGARGTFAWYFARDRLAVASLAVIVLIGLAALLAPWLPNADEGAGVPNPINAFLSPSLAHPLGTDQLGRDQLSRIIFGARVSIVLAVAVVFFSAVLGTILGAIAGYLGGWVDEAIMRFTDMVLAFPSLVLALVLGAILGPSLINVILAISLVWWPWYTRLVRGQATSVRERQYVQAARSIGASQLWIIRRHVLPNVLGPVRIQATYDFGAAILTGAALSFLGLGPRPPTADWGSMINSGRQYILSGEWWLAVFPGLAIYLTVLAFNIVGDRIQTLADPRSRREMVR